MLRGVRPAIGTNELRGKSGSASSQKIYVTGFMATEK